MQISKYRVLRREKGFTLVELLVVIAIIGILSTLLILQLGIARAKARDTKRIADIQGIQAAVEQYYDDNSASYPTALSDANLSKYLTNGVVPKDPLAGQPYHYAFSPATSPTKYMIWVQLETKSNGLNGDSDIDSTGWQGEPRVGANETCTGSYNYAGTNYECTYDVGQK